MRSQPGSINFSVIFVCFALLTTIVAATLLAPEVDVPQEVLGTRAAPLDVLGSGTANDTTGYAINILMINDLDSDGNSEIAIAEPGNDTEADGCGAVHFLPGNLTYEPGMWDVGNAVFSITGVDLNASFGYEMRMIGDFTGDIIVDYAFSAPHSNGTGAVFIYELPTLMALYAAGVDVNITTADQRINGTYPGQMFGASLAGMGDINMDGFEDLAVGSPGNGSKRGRVDMFWGKPASPNATLQSNFTIDGPNPLSFFGSEIESLGDVDGVPGEDILINAPLEGKAYIYYIEHLARADLWDNADQNGIVDFTGSINSTGNTFGWDGADDGWDSSPIGVYGGTETQVVYNPTIPISELEIVVGGNIGSGGFCSGAYGVEFNLTNETIKDTDRAYIEFDYTFEDAQGFEVGERLWIKGRINDSTTLTWLGSDLDSSGADPDPENEIWTINDGSGPFTGGGHYKQDITALLASPGTYYLDLGAKITAWSIGTETFTVTFDNVEIRFDKATSTDVIEITSTPDPFQTIGNLGDLSGDMMDDFIIGSPESAKAYYFETQAWPNGTIIDTATQSTATFQGTPGTYFGFSVKTAGDMTGTSTNDIAIGIPRYGTGIEFHVGAVNVYDGASLSGTITEADLHFNGSEPMGGLGANAFGLGDINGDSKPDLFASGQWINGIDDILRHTTNGTGWILSRLNEAPIIHFNEPASGANVSGTIEINLTCIDPDGDNIPGVELFLSNDTVNWTSLGTNSTPNGSTYIFHWDTTTVPDGDHYLRANTSDILGNKNTSVVLDLEVFNPASLIILPINPVENGTLSGTAELSVNVTFPFGIAGPGVEFFIGQDMTNWTLIDNTSAETEINSSIYAVTLDTRAYEEGLYHFMVNATDLLSKGSIIIPNVTLDNDYPPVIEFLEPIGGEVLSGITTLTVNVTDPDNDINDEGVHFWYQTSSSSWKKIGTAGLPEEPNGTIYSIPLDTTTYEDGTDYSFWAHVTDKKLGYAEVFTPGNITILNVFAPNITLDTPSNPSALSGSVALRAEVTDPDMNIDLATGIIFSYSSNKADWTNIATITQPVDPMADPLVFNAEWDVSGVANGDYWLRVRVFDLDGMSDTDVLTTQVTIKNIHSPEIEIRSPKEGDVLKDTVTIQVWAVDLDGDITSEGVTVYYAVPGLDPDWIKIGSQSTGNQTGIYTVSWDTTAVEDGNYLLKANVSDSTGLDAYDQTIGTISIDNVQPPPTVFPDDDDDDGDETFADLILNNLMYVGLGFLILMVLIVILIILIVVIRKNTAKRREEKRAEEEKAKALDDLHAGMDQLAKELSKMEIEPDAVDTREIAPSMEFFDKPGEAVLPDQPAEPYHDETAYTDDDMDFFADEALEDLGEDLEEEEEPDEEELDVDEDDIEIDEDDIDIAVPVGKDALLAEEPKPEPVVEEDDETDEDDDDETYEDDEEDEEPDEDEVELELDDDEDLPDFLQEADEDEVDIDDEVNIRVR